MKTIYLVTWNPWKVESFNNILKNKNLNIKIEMLSWDYPEIKEDGTTSQVVLEWAKFCSDKYMKNVIVQDTGLFIEELNGFPWVNTKFSLQTIWNKWILKLMDWVNNRKAKWIFSLWYCEVWWQAKEFTWILEWKISNECRWNLWFWFDEIFIPDWYNETFWENPKLRDKLSPFNQTIDELIEYLNNLKINEKI
jgi:XTP/dITP diphosphohydrolase